MSKIICDVCGASYDDAAGACPLCGWNPGAELATDIDDFDPDLLDAVLADEPAAAAAPKAKPAVNFAAANAQRPDAPKKTAAPAKQDDDDEDDEEEDEEKSGTNVFLVIVLIILILALLGASGYLLWTRILRPNDVGSDANKPGETVSAIENASDDRSPSTPAAAGTQEDPLPSQVVTAETDSTETGVPCTNLTLVGSMEKLTFAGQYWRLMARAEPTDTTDKIVYTSSNESVVTIDEYGRVTAVGEGTATITIACGDQKLETTAVVDFGTAASAAGTGETAGTQGTAAAGGNTAGTAASAGSTGTLTITYHGKARNDLTIGRKGAYITLELDGIPAESATWRTSDSSVATVNNGNVVAIGRGQCVVTVTYNGQSAEAVIRCSW